MMNCWTRLKNQLYISLSLVIVNNDLYEFIDMLKVDKERLFTPHRAIGKGQRLIFTDHFSLHLVFKNVLTKSLTKPVDEKHIMWNTNKPEGWNCFKELTENNQDLNELLEDENVNSPTIFIERLERIINKAKYKAFGKVTFSNRSISNKPLEKLYNERKVIISNTEDNEKILEVEQFRHARRSPEQNVQNITMCT